MKRVFLIVLTFLWLPCCYPATEQTASSRVPVCKHSQLQSAVGPYGVAMGSQYIEIIFKNASKTACRLSGVLDFELFDSSGVEMPIKVEGNRLVNADGTGADEAVLEPRQRTAITIQSSDGTGLDESIRCATRMRISISAEQRKHPLIAFKTISCGANVNVTGFHSVRE